MAADYHLNLMQCRSCKHEGLESLINLGSQYLSDFRTDDIKPPKYPLELMRCPNCNFVQLRESAPLSEMYTPNYGFKSGVNDTIKNDLKSIVDEAKTYTKGKIVMDIGANDGTLLNNYDSSYYKIAFEPITKLANQIQAQEVINDFFFPIKAKCDIITSISMFYDVEDPEKFVRDVSSMLKEDGVWIIQQNYFLTSLKLNGYDNICHEHIGYHTLLSMEHLLNRLGLEVVKVSTSMINGGSFRTIVRWKGHKVDSSVSKQRQIEKDYKLDTSEPYENFSLRIEEETNKLKELLDKIKKEGKKVYIYGASTRGGTIWQYAGLDVKDLPYAVERNPEKVGKKIASIGVPIISEEQARQEKPEYMLVSIWFFEPEINKRESEYLKNGGHLIYPLPEVKII